MDKSVDSKTRKSEFGGISSTGDWIAGDGMRGEEAAPIKKDGEGTR